ncbi:MAG: hypothetical protein HYU66_26280, partial [Armatimonadetes bacterium]|nr:hypothetical protein [Armatimonadota bacterium]
MRAVHRLLTACLLFSAACAAEGYRCEFIDLPAYVVEGRPFTVKMQYATPPGQRVSLRCELKSTAHVVLAGARAEVTGEGVQILTLTAPERAAQGKLLLAGWMGEDWRESLCPIVNTPTIEVASEARARRLEAMQAAATTLRAKYIAACTPDGNVGIIGSVATDWPTDLVVDLADRLRQRKLGVSLVQPGEAVTGVLDPAVFDLVVVADARLLPVDALEALGRFANSGGNLMVLGGPPLRRALWPFQGKFLESDAYRLAVAEAVKPELWSDFEQGTGGEWRRATNDTAAASAAKPAAG